MGSKKRFFGRRGNRKKRADRVVRPYGCGGRSEVARMHCYCSQTLIRLLRRHLPRGGRQSAAAVLFFLKKRKKRMGSKRASFGGEKKNTVSK